MDFRFCCPMLLTESNSRFQLGVNQAYSKNPIRTKDILDRNPIKLPIKLRKQGCNYFTCHLRIQINLLAHLYYMSKHIIHCSPL